MLEKAPNINGLRNNTGIANMVAGAGDSPVWPAATSQMKIDVAVNADSKLWVIHDRPFPDYLEWVEFDGATRTMTFITAGGKLQELGLIIHPPMDKLVMAARQACLIMLRNGEIRDMGLVPLIVTS